MLSNEAFAKLIARVQAGDPDAAGELIRHYESDIRMAVRVRMRVQDGRVRRMLDSMDITQSVLASLFAGIAAGRYVPESPKHLVGLLVAMTRNKLLGQVRQQRRLKRDVRKSYSFDPATHDLPASQESPSQMISGKELLHEFRKRLSNEERELAERRSQSLSWSEIARELGGSAEGRRKQLERAFARVAHELGLDGEIADSVAM